MKFERVYCFGRENGKANEDDFVTAYVAENGMRIEVEYTIASNSPVGYRVGNHSYTYLKSAKAACYKEEEK